MHTIYSDGRFEARELLKKADEMGLRYIEPDKESVGSYYCNTRFQEVLTTCYMDNIEWLEVSK